MANVSITFLALAFVSVAFLAINAEGNSGRKMLVQGRSISGDQEGGSNPYKPVSEPYSPDGEEINQAESAYHGAGIYVPRKPPKSEYHEAGTWVPKPPKSEYHVAGTWVPKPPKSEYHEAGIYANDGGIWIPVPRKPPK